LQLEYDEDGTPLQFAGVSVDMTDQREADLQREELTRREVAARRDARAASRAKDEFLAMLGHELRNPLGAISAATDVLEAAPPASESADEARTIVARQTRNLAHLVHDLLDVGRAIAGDIVLARRPVNLAARAGAGAQHAAGDGRLATHDLHLQAEDAWVDGDAVRLEQVLSNLLGNALKYTPCRAAASTSRSAARAPTPWSRCAMPAPASRRSCCRACSTSSCRASGRWTGAPAAGHRPDAGQARGRAAWRQRHGQQFIRPAAASPSPAGDRPAQPAEGDSLPAAAAGACW
jgi:hypothetical protein